MKILPIPLPPLPEQKAIAHVLRTVQGAKEAAARVIQAARELKKSLMRHLFTYGPVPLDQVHRVPLRETDLGPLPAHWQVVRLGEVAEQIFAGGDVPKSRFSKVQTDTFTVPIYTNGKDEAALYGYTDIATVNSPSLTISSRGTIGHSAIRLTPFYPAIRLIVVIPNPKFICLYYLKNAIDRIDFSKHFEKSPIPQFTVPMAKNLVIPLPPLPEQQAIARILQAVDRKIAAEEARQQALEALFKTLLHHLMTGQVRVVPPTAEAAE